MRSARQGVRSAFSAARSQLAQLPAWALVTIAIALAAVAGELAYLAIRSAGEDGATGPTAAQLPCDRRAVDDAVEGGRFEHEVRDVGTVPPLADLLEIYDAKLVGCADLTGDGVDEMVVRLLERGVAPVDGGVATDPARDSPSPWAVYVASDGAWAPAATRTHVATVDVAIEGDRIVERTPALVEGDPLCCPSGERRGTLRWDGEAFAYRADGAPRGSTIALSDGAPAALAGFDLRSGSLPAAAELFGPPTTYAPAADACPAGWTDLGLAIEFAHPAGGDPCGPQGRVATVRVGGPEARLAGWKTQEGATLETRERALRKLYPDLAASEETTFAPQEPAGRLFTLAGSSLAARVDGGRVIGFEASVSAAAP